MYSTDISGVVLAGGRGSRLGGEDKGLVDVNSRPMISYCIERFAPQVSTLFINANRSLTTYRELGFPVITDQVADFAGPLAGIAAALSSCKTSYLATVPCDSPFLPTDLVERLASPLQDSQAAVSVAISGGRPQPVFAVIATQLYESLYDYLTSGGRKIMTWYRQQTIVEVDFGPDDSPFANINSPADLATAAKQLPVQ
jgi:molybdopterin-guanine dinucleotide biosynthesis protein A